jgi:hypothetical protein
VYALHINKYRANTLVSSNTYKVKSHRINPIFVKKMAGPEGKIQYGDMSVNMLI